MDKNFNWFKWYTPQNRILSHLTFWVIVVAFYYLNYSRLVSTYVWVYVAKDVLILITLFYTSPFVISKWLLKGKIFLFIAYVAFAFFWWLSITFLAVYIANPHITTPSTEFAKRYIRFLLNGGYASLFTLKKLSVLYMDFVFMIALPLCARLLKSVFQQSYEILKLQVDKLTMELDILKAQVSPHFLFNTLNVIYRMADKNDPDTKVSILQLADMMRYSLYEASNEKVLLKKEIAFIDNYVQLARARYRDEVKIICDLPDLPEPFTILPLLLVPLVENAFKHGPDRSLTNAWVYLEVKVKDDILYFEAANGVNPNSKKPQRGGIGLKNVKKRLELHYNEHYQLTIDDHTPDQFKVNLIINLKYT